MSVIDVIADSVMGSIMDSITYRTDQWALDSCLLYNVNHRVIVGNWDDPKSLIIKIGDLTFSTPKGSIPIEYSKILSKSIVEIVKKHQKSYVDSITTNL